MRLLFLSNLFPPLVLGGYELACANVARAMMARGHEVRVLTAWSHLPASEPDPAFVRRCFDLHWYIPYLSANQTVAEHDLHATACSSYGNTFRLLQEIRDFEPDLVYVWNINGLGGLALLDLLNKVGVPWALHLMDRIPTELMTHARPAAASLFNGQGRQIYRNARILAISQHIVDEIERTSGITFPQGVDIVPAWANLSNSTPHEPYLRDGIARFVTAGTVQAHKGIDLILEASARLKAEGVKFVVDIYGDGELPKYIDMSKVLEVDDCVNFRGQRRQADLIALYATYDAFLFPTWEREPQAFAPVEAIGCGTTAIITGTCGNAERLVDNVHCLKIERNAEQLADAMRRVAHGDVDIERLGRAGIRLVQSDLRFDKCMDTIEKSLREHVRPWKVENASDDRTALLAFVKHNLSVWLRFG